MNARRTLLTALALGATTVFFATLTPVLAQQTDTTLPGGNGTVTHGPRFVDADGDGINDNAPDHDGDGIPNGQDADYVRPNDGSGPRHQGQGVRGVEGAAGRGMKHGQGRGRGAGVAGAAEKGAKIGQGPLRRGAAGANHALVKPEAK